MIYISFLTRDPLPTFNSIYAYAKFKKFPQNILILYTQDSQLQKLKNLITYLFKEYGKEVRIGSKKIEDDFSDLKRIFEDLDEEVVVDITGARKTQIISLMSFLKKGKITYLKLDDMKYAHLPLMMRPMCVQRIMEVSLNERNNQNINE